MRIAVCQGGNSEMVSERERMFTMREADLRKADLRSAHLRRVNFDGADLTRANDRLATTQTLGRGGRVGTQLWGLPELVHGRTYGTLRPRQTRTQSAMQTGTG